MNGIHGLFSEPIIGPLKSKMAEICHLENRHHVIFLPKSGECLTEFNVIPPPRATLQDERIPSAILLKIVLRRILFLFF